MLELKQIIKDYKAGDTTVRALNGISLQFREHEFVSILGPSGCGKTTLLNIVGGLDQYTSGDLVINGVSTKQYKDADWDTYRNHSIGFVFQSYNLIPHQTVLANVELALTLSGISKKERRARAAQALENVGLGDQLHKKPNQLSGGQMQRVAIARALVNDPDILLADEPTGALDTQTSVQIMDILQEIAHKKLIIMVTHNPELAEKYSSRIISVLDGQVVGDTNPYDGTDVAPAVDACPAENTEKPQGTVAKKEKKRKKKKSMSFFTALSLSLNNLMTKKGRTFMTSFAGSIGIIGIALILSVSTGVNNYINAVQRDTLASYPIELHSETMDIMAVMNTLMEESEDDKETHDLDKIYPSNILPEMVTALKTTASKTNDLASFKKHLESTDKFDAHLTAVQYAYNFNWNILVKENATNPDATDSDIIVSDLFGWMKKLPGGEAISESLNMLGTMGVWTEMLAPLDENSETLVNDVLLEQYELVDDDSRWPTAANEVVLVVNERNEISDLSLYALGLRTDDEMLLLANGESLPDGVSKNWTFDEIRSMEFRLILAAENYKQYDDSKAYYKLTDTAAGREELYNDAEKGFTLKVVGIVRPIEGATASTLTSGTIGYTSALADMVLERTQSNSLLNDQRNNRDWDLLSNKPFKGDISVQKKIDTINEELTKMEALAPNQGKTMIIMEQIKSDLNAKSSEELTALINELLANASPDMLPEGVPLDQLTPETILSNAESKEIFLGYAAMAELQKPDSEYLAQYAKSIEELVGELNENELDVIFSEVQSEFSDSTYETVLFLLGDAKEENPASIYLFAKSFDDKDAVAELIRDYNDKCEKNGEKDKVIEYTDMVGLLMSSITLVINAITYVLIAFVAISLIVSSIMIGIITYISVLERTKEIGILRAIGASKRDVSRVFNAETLTVGFVAGMIGIGLTLIFNVIINIILFSLTGIPNLKASLPVVGAIVLVAISMLLTFIAGLVPSKFAAKRNPVEALRSE